MSKPVAPYVPPPIDRKVDWKFSQLFGDKTPYEQIHEEDIITAVEFDTTGKFLSLGDKAGRLIVFETPEPLKGKAPVYEYQYLTELQSHVKEFDYLKSTEIEERINQMQWLRPQGNNLYVLTTNDKTIKYWKVNEKKVKKAILVNRTEKDTKFPQMQTTEVGYFPTLLKTYPQLHAYHINSLSMCSNGENFISGDDLRINLWSLDRGNEAFNIVDLKPEDLNEIAEVITSAKFHPIANNIFLYSTSKGIIKIGDLRKSALCEKTAMSLEVKENPASKNFFTDIIVSICDATFSKNGKYVFSRDFCTVKVWDLANTSKPLQTISIYDPIKTKLCELYENECIFDKFSICSGPDSNTVLTGMFNSNFHVFDVKRDTNLQFELNFNKKSIFKVIPKRCTDVLGSNYDYTRKVLKSAYHPKEHMCAIACLNCLYFYKGV
jgi:serine/threonine-protein phosphatase 2A regulatory subunit B